jgi:hypothetical protein
MPELKAEIGKSEIGNSFQASGLLTIDCGSMTTDL